MSRKQKKNLIRILAAVAVLLLSVLLPVADWIKISHCACGVRLGWLGRAVGRGSRHSARPGI